MSDNDLMRRGDVRRVIAEFISDNNALIDRWAAVIIEAIMAIIDKVPAVSQEMTEELLDIERRMFHEDFDAWLEFSDYETGGREEEAVAFAEKWAQEHPEERSENDE